ncbi:esterase B1-like isoform X2 [Scaptodrosophila lebanonensis]|uniref:carboxylesterase n=1 Tax=Drosophila lebanonensis TaxID=7225 RepID=A0A6J2T4M6_DROLE|nr:esterase B1-like isoform X2 [Scaptodrosophila lebanonensis]
MFTNLIVRRGFCLNQLFCRRYSKMKNDRSVKVPVQQGIVVGRERELPSGLKYECFLGVPYAVPPVGKLRFRSPVPLEHFDADELDCTKEGDVSHQRDPLTQSVVGSENCLFLNVFTPKKRTTEKLPVMVWIHGGGFFFGNGNSDYHFPAKLLEQDVVVVTLNYRLGALGFLYLPEEGIHGNAGLKDQRLALQWVQENIANFNGDPKNVTLFGESAGAASVQLHTYSKHANKLFHKAIMQSGTANMEWVLQNQPEYKTRRLTELLGGSIDDSQSILKFLQSPKVTPLAMLANTMALLTPDERRRHLPLPFKPVVEQSTSPDSFIDVNIMDLLYEKDRLNGMPVIMGYTSAEGIAMVVNAKRKLDIYDQDLARLVPRNLVVEPNAAEALEAAKDMRAFYFNGQALTSQSLDNLVDLLTDFHFNIDLQHAAEIHAHRQTSSPLYFYRFDYVGNRNMYKRMLQCEKLRGACHGDELFYLFQMSDDESPMTKEDDAVSHRICEMWANFAKHGRPSRDWTPVQPHSDKNQAYQLDYFRIDRECGMRRNPDGERIEFWRSMYKRYKPNCYEALRAKL